MHGEKKGSIIIFYPHNPFSPRHGSHLRCLQQLSDLNASYRIVFSSSYNLSDSPWPNTRLGLRELASRNHLDQICLFESSLLGSAYTLLSKSCSYINSVLPVFNLSRIINFVHQLCFVGWFTLLSWRHHPVAIIMHYTHWAYLAKFSRVYKVIELHDLLPVNAYLSSRTIEEIKNFGLNIPDSSILPLTYIDSLDQLPRDVAALVCQESTRLNQYDLVWMISSREEKLLRAAGLRSPSDVIEPIVNTLSSLPPKSLPPLLPIGPNPFNTYSLLCFIRDVIPLIDDRLPTDFEIQVTGSFWRNKTIKLNHPFKYYGLVNDYLDRVAKSSFLIAPTSVGTGQQVKIFEALSVGTPVIAYRNSMPLETLADNPGIIAVDNPVEFADAIVNLSLNHQLISGYWDLALRSAQRHDELRNGFKYTKSLIKHCV